MVLSGAQEPIASPGDFLSGSSELAERMRTTDWSSTPLGPMEHWPQSLRTSISICLASRFPIVLYWGPEYVVLYNDAYSAILGSKHPWALGKRCCECWAEIWETIGPMLDGVISTGEATWSDDLLLELQRFGYSEECYFSFSFSPIRVETGTTGGVFTAVIETTARLIAERRLNTLRELAARITDANSESRMLALATETLGRNRYDLSFAVLYLPSPDGGSIVAAGCAGIPSTHALCNGTKDPGHSDLPLLAAVRAVFKSSELSLVSDLQRQFPDVPQGIWGIPPVEAVALPVILPGHSSAAACLLAGLNARKRFDDDYRVFLEMLARQLASNLSAARAHEEERKRAQALAELDHAKTAFFSNVSHEFRTPLTLMLGPVEAMLERARPSTVVSKEELQLVHRNGMRLLKLVNTLLDFSRIEAGRVQAHYEPSDVAALTADTASAFRSAMEQAGLEYVIDCPPLPDPVYLDRNMWEKIVLNLISNAFKFTLSGRVSVRVRSADDHIELEVEDTGLGIPEEQRPHVFDRFHRVEGLRGRTQEGSGIGLALVQELVKLHDGSIRLESALGKGSKFIVCIPTGHAHTPAARVGSQERILKSNGVAAPAYVDEAIGWLSETERPADVPPVFASDSVQAPHVQTATGRILLADDNADMRAYVRRLLGENYEVDSVSNGLEALESARNHPPDVVLSDVMMPGMDGFALLRELRADPSTSTIPVILLSARAGEEARIEGMEAGADDYIVKPFTARELLARVGAHLALGRLRRENAERERGLRAELELRVEERTAELQLANQQLRELSSRLQQMQDEERRRLARELHDSVGQLLVAIAMNVEVVKTERDKLSPDIARRVDENANIIQQLITDIRTLSHLLHPPLLDEVGLPSALRWYVDGFAQRSGIDATLELPDNLERLPADMEIAIFRAVQEALTNVHRHSGSRCCSVKLTQDHNYLRVEIADQGKGIAKDKYLSLTRSGGVGIRGLQERLRQLGGTLEIASTDHGTTVTASLRVPEAVESRHGEASLDGPTAPDSTSHRTT
jgi:signal transduction histidine kinase